MKKSFKNVLSYHKGKVLTKELIDLLSKLCEEEVGNEMNNEGLVFTTGNGYHIHYGDCDCDDKNWRVSDYRYDTIAEYKTLAGAVNCTTNR